MTKLKKPETNSSYWKSDYGLECPICLGCSDLDLAARKYSYPRKDELLRHFKTHQVPPFFAKAGRPCDILILPVILMLWFHFTGTCSILKSAMKSLMIIYEIDGLLIKTGDLGEIGGPWGFEKMTKLSVCMYRNSLLLKAETELSVKGCQSLELCFELQKLNVSESL